jgi:hypothetical protein
VTSFTVEGETYLAFANSNKKNEVWKWEGNGFIDISDTIPVLYSHGVTTFKVEGETYLAFSSDNYRKNGVWKWNGSGFEDVSSDMLTTTFNAYGVTSFEIGGSTYLAFATAGQNSILKLEEGTFVHTKKGGVPSFKRETYSQGIESFEIGGISYLVFANQGQRNEVWKWNEDGFVDISDKIPAPLPDEWGNIQESYSQGVESFKIGGITYLAFANQGQRNEVWKWNGNEFIDISDKTPAPLSDE